MARGQWSLKRIPESADRLLFGFPYAGGGASLFRQWPQLVGDAWFCPLAPPGREHRFGEPPLRTHAEFASAVTEFIAEAVAGRPFAFFGHCGGVPLALNAVLALERAGQPLPTRVVASGWGAPHRGLYGRLNFIDLRTADLRAEVSHLFEQLGVPVRSDFVDIAADILRVDLELHRPHLYDATHRLPVPVTVVGWTRDEVVPAAEVCTGWRECADVTYHVLDGEHFAFTRCPEHLRDLLVAEDRGDGRDQYPHDGSNASRL